MPDPTGGQRADHRAHRHGRKQRADDLRAGVELGHGEHGEQRTRHPEDHRDEVGVERRLQHPPPPQEVESLDDLAPRARHRGGRRLLRRGRRLRPHHPRGGEDGREAAHVDGVRRGQSQLVDDDAADAGTDDEARVPHHLVQGEGDGKLAGLHEVREHRGPNR